MEKLKVDFHTLFDAEIDKLEAAKDVFRARVESAAIHCFGEINAEEHPLFAPPEKPVKIECWHCGDVYMSDEIVLQYRPHMQAALMDMGANLNPLWWCRNKTCDGGGFGHDLHQTRKRIKKMKAE